MNIHGESYASQQELERVNESLREDIEFLKKEVFQLNEKMECMRQKMEDFIYQYTTYGNYNRNL